MKTTLETSGDLGMWCLGTEPIHHISVKDVGAIGDFDPIPQ